MMISQAYGSVTGPRDNTLYFGGRNVQHGNYSSSARGVALDRGSDGDIDALAASRQRSLETSFGQVSTGQTLAGIWGGYGAGASGNEGNPSRPFGEKESFEASIHGDPHFAMQGTINGQEVDSKFDNQDVGNRTQYAGAGFKLETETVPWGSENGAAVVGSSTVTTGFGRGQDQVTVNADGSVLVNGEQVSMEAGQTQQLNRTSSLSFNDDGTYTVSSRNGKVSNTFDVNQHENGNYINIDSSVSGVQTGGWFQQQATAG
jgi:hypothetical protein